MYESISNAFARGDTDSAKAHVPPLRSEYSAYSICCSHTRAHARMLARARTHTRVSSSQSGPLATAAVGLVLRQWTDLAGAQAQVREMMYLVRIEEVQFLR
jgi:hypothetical protein